MKLFREEVINRQDRLYGEVSLIPAPRWTKATAVMLAAIALITMGAILIKIPSIATVDGVAYNVVPGLVEITNIDEIHSVPDVMVGDRGVLTARRGVSISVIVEAVASPNSTQPLVVTVKTARPDIVLNDTRVFVKINAGTTSLIGWVLDSGRSTRKING